MIKGSKIPVHCFIATVFILKCGHYNSFLKNLKDLLCVLWPTGLLP